MYVDEFLRQTPIYNDLLRRGSRQNFCESYHKFSLDSRSSTNQNNQDLELRLQKCFDPTHELHTRAYCKLRTLRFLLHIRPVLINVAGLVFDNSTYDRKSSTVIKINSTIHFFRTVRIIGRAVQ